MSTAQLPRSALALASAPVATALILPAEWPHHCPTASSQLPQQPPSDLTYATHTIRRCCWCTGLQPARYPLFFNAVLIQIEFSCAHTKKVLPRNNVPLAHDNSQTSLWAVLIGRTFPIVTVKTVHSEVNRSTGCLFQGTHSIWIFQNVPCQYGGSWLTSRADVQHQPRRSLTAPDR